MLHPTYFSLLLDLQYIIACYDPRLFSLKNVRGRKSTADEILQLKSVQETKY